MRSARREWERAALGVFAMMMAAGCGPTMEPCGEGERRACICFDGRSGSQTCDSEGFYSACECTGGPVDAGPRDAYVGPAAGAFGAPCSRNGDCDSNLCLASGRCSRPCGDVTDCAPGWSCAPLPGVGDICQCTSEGLTESCNGLDDDCDGIVDQGARCDGALVCQAGECVCPPERVCGGACVDLQTDPQHCGACGNACATSDWCVTGGCEAVWTRQFGTSTADSATAVAADRAGNVFVAGGTGTGGALPGQTSAGAGDAFVRAYDPTGVEVWTRQFGSSSNDYASAVAVDASGNVYVAGSTSGTLPGETSAGSRNAFVRKYDPTGAELWTRQFGSSAGATAVAVDASGNVYVAGNTREVLPGQTSVGGPDTFIRKYNAAGIELWTRQFGTSGNDYSYAVAVDGSGNVIIVGMTDGALPGQTSSGSIGDAFVRAYDGAGAELWTHQFGWASGANAVAVDGSGNVFVAGYTGGVLPGQTSVDGQDAFIRKYNAAGTELWTRQFGTTTEVAGASAVAVDGGGNVFIAGVTAGALPGQTSAGSEDAFVRAYDGAGAELWTRQFGSSSADRALGVALERTGNLVVAGWTEGALPGQTSADGRDAFVMRIIVP